MTTIRSRYKIIITSLIITNAMIVQSACAYREAEQKNSDCVGMLGQRIALSAPLLEASFRSLYIANGNTGLGNQRSDKSFLSEKSVKKLPDAEMKEIRKNIKNIFKEYLGEDEKYASMESIAIYTMADFAPGAMKMPLANGEDVFNNKNYAFSKKTEEGTLNLFLCETLWNDYLKKDELFLAEIIDYFWHKDMLDNPSAEVAQRAYLFTRKQGLSPRHNFLLEEIQKSEIGRKEVAFLAGWFGKVLESPENENMITYDYKLKWHIENILHQHLPMTPLSEGINWDIVKKFSEQLPLARSEEEIGQLLRTCLLRGVGFRGVTIYVVRKNETSGWLQYRSIWREGMKGKRWLKAWKNFPRKDEKYKNLLTADLKTQYLHIKERDKSDYVYASWLLRDIFLYRFGETSIISRVISFLSSVISVASDMPAQLAIAIIKKLRPDWLSRVNESLNLAILNSEGEPLAQVLINNWLSEEAEPLFANEQVRQEKLELISLISLEVSQAIQLVRLKNKLAYTESLLDGTRKSLRGIKRIYKEVARSLHATKNKWAACGGFATRFKRKLADEKTVYSSVKEDKHKIGEMLKAIVEMTRKLEEERIIEEFEVNKTRQLAQKLNAVLEDNDAFVVPGEDAPDLKSAKFVIHKEQLHDFATLKILMFQTKSVGQLNQLYAAAMPIYRNTLQQDHVTLLYRLQRDTITTSVYLKKQSWKQKELDDFLKQNLSIIQEFLSIYEPIFSSIKNHIANVLQVYNRLTDEDKKTLEAYFPFFNKAATDLINTNEEFFETINSVGVQEQELDIAMHDISHLLEGAIEKYRNIAEKGNCFFVTKIESGLIGWVDRKEFDLIMLNLLSNAIRYSLKEQENTPGRIEIIAKREQDAVVITVVDEGIGIAPEKISRVGTSFDTLDRTGLPFKGSGIGLSYVKTILEKISGNKISNYFEVYSEGEGKGSTFTVRFPLSTIGEGTGNELIEEKAEEPEDPDKTRYEKVELMRKLSLAPIHDPSLIRDLMKGVGELAKDKNSAVKGHAERTLQGLQSTLDMLKRQEEQLINQAI